MEGRLEQDKAVTGKDVAVTHSDLEMWMFAVLWVVQWPWFCPCLDKIITWPCFVSFYHSLRVALPGLVLCGLRMSCRGTTVLSLGCHVKFFFLSH